ncbi:MAG: hypothetical protein WC408_04185 [Candidatus Micrarchaeia archaeon]|jgi:hypothetical protein
MRKGQVALEFVSACMMLILVWTAFTILSNEWNKKSYMIADTTSGQELLRNIYYEANNAKAAGDGYSHAFTISRSLSGASNYTINLYPTGSTIEILFRDSSASITLPFDSFSGTIECCEILVSNNGGMVVFS